MSGLVRVTVHSWADDTYLATLPRRSAVAWQNELNAPGTGTFQLHLDDALLAGDAGLLDEFNIVRFWRGGRCEKAWFIEDVRPTLLATGERSRNQVTVAGRGVEALLSMAVVYPEYHLTDTLRAHSPQDRTFDFSSQDGAWRQPPEWLAPVGVAQRLDTTARKGNPRGWPDPSAQWLWSTDPLLPADPGRNYFRAEFDHPSGSNVIVYASCDNDMSLRMDGEEIASTDPRTRFNWRTTFEIPMYLDAGTHTLAAWVDNAESAATNPAGFIWTIMSTDALGRPDQVLYRSTPASTVVRGYGSPPGWSGAQIIETLFDEAVARGVALSGLTLDFDGGLDSSSPVNAWSDIQDRRFSVGTPLDQVLAAVSEVSLDFWVDPASPLVMKAYTRRGSDLRDSVRITKAPTDLGATRNNSTLRNQGIARHKDGWIERIHTPSRTAHGRREVSLTLGTAGSDSMANSIVDELFEDTAYADTTVEATVTSAAGPQFGEDFDIGDTVMGPATLGGGFQPVRVMSASASESDDGSLVSYALECYPEEV